MLPTPSQQIRSIRLRMVETIIPEIPRDATFAREQAAFILTTLDWLLETNEHQYRYEVVENAEYRRFLGTILDTPAAQLLDRESLEPIRLALSQPGPSPGDGEIPVAELLAQNRRLKKLGADLYRSLSAQTGPDANPARAEFTALSDRQGQRELAFFRGTGFTQSAQDLGSILRSGPPPTNAISDG